MLTKNDIRYSRTWVRILCSCSVSAILSYLMCFEILTPLENALAALIAPEAVELYGRIHLFLEVQIIFLFGFLIGVPRIRYPFLMIIYIATLIFAYTACIIGVFYLFNIILPMAAPLIAISAGAAILGSFAWHEEQSNLRRLQGLEQMHRQLTDMLVHDLKKKLSSLMLSIAMLDKEQRSETEDELITTLKTSSEQMLLLVTNLLDIRKFEAGRMNIHSDNISLKELLTKSINEHKTIADMLGVRLCCLATDDAVVQADRQMLSRIVMNLIWNAIQHAPRATDIEIDCQMKDGEASICVANRGDTIPAEVQQDLFKPFQSGSKQSFSGIFAESTGLGLAFCKLAVEAHNGSITVESPWKAHGDGVLVAVRFRVPSTTLQ